MAETAYVFSKSAEPDDRHNISPLSYPAQVRCDELRSDRDWGLNAPFFSPRVDPDSMDPATYCFADAATFK